MLFVVSLCRDKNFMVTISRFSCLSSWVLVGFSLNSRGIHVGFSLDSRRQSFCLIRNKFYSSYNYMLFLTLLMLNVFSSCRICDQSLIAASLLRRWHITPILTFSVVFSNVISTSLNSLPYFVCRQRKESQ